MPWRGRASSAGELAVRRCLPLCRGRSWHAAVPRRREGKREGRSCAVSTLERFGRRAGGCRLCLPEFVLAGQGDGLLDSSSQGIQEPSQQDEGRLQSGLGGLHPLRENGWKTRIKGLARQPGGRFQQEKTESLSVILPLALHSSSSSCLCAPALHRRNSIND